MVDHIPLKMMMEVKTNFEDADFWLVRKGREDVLGRPMKEFASGHIGLKLNDLGRQIADPQYLYYYFSFLHGRGEWAKLAKGSLSLKHITVSDVKNFLLPVELSDNI